MQINQNQNQIDKTETCQTTQAQQQEKNEEQSSFQSMYNFPQIVDVFEELKKNNLLPLLKILKYQQKLDINIYQKDKNGYNFFHYIIQQGRYDMIKILTDKFPRLLSERTGQDQTNLMIALNQDNINVIDFFLNCEQANLSHKDFYGFDVYSYMIKNNTVPLFFIVLYKNYTNKIKMSQERQKQVQNSIKFFQDFPLYNNSYDKNKCTLLHWCCFQDSLFFTKLFFRFGVDFQVHDSSQLTPFERASENNSVKVINFLTNWSGYQFHTNYILHNQFQPYQFNFFPRNIKVVLENYESPLFLKAYEKNYINQQKLVRRYINFFFDYNLKYNFGVWFYVLYMITLLFVVMSNFTSIIGLHTIFYCFIKLFIVVLTALFAVRNDLYQQKVKCEKNSINLNDSEQNVVNQQKIRPILYHSQFVNYKVDSLQYKNYLKSQNLDTYIDDTLSELSTIEKKFNFLNEFNSSQFCPICLIHKPYKTHHVKKINLCVRGFYLYEKFFDKVIYGQNIKQYAILLFFNLILAFYELYQIFCVDNLYYTFYNIFYFFLVRQNYFQILVVGSFLYFLLCNTTKFIIILYGIKYNLTYDEIMNTHRYPYLFKKKNLDFFYDNPNDQGFRKNLKMFLNN